MAKMSFFCALCLSRFSYGSIFLVDVDGAAQSDSEERIMNYSSDGPTFSFKSASLTGRETGLEVAGVVVSGILGEL